MKLCKNLAVELIKEKQGVNSIQSRLVCFLLNSVIASLKAGSDFAALSASMNSFHSGVSEIGLRRFTDTDLIISDDFCILSQRTYALSTLINLSQPEVLGY